MDFFIFLQPGLNEPLPIKTNKSKKVINRRRIKKSPVRTIRQQTVDDQTGPRLAGEARAAALAAAAALSGNGMLDDGGQPGPSSDHNMAGEECSGVQTAVSGPGRNIFGRPVRGPAVSRSAPASPSNGNVIPPPPSATVVVCVLAGTGRADLWVRNNRGQTPLDLCPADQPLRRALIKCCDAAAQARNGQTTNTTATTVGETDGSSAPTLSAERPQQSQLTHHNIPPDYSIKAPYHDAYAPLMSKEQDPPKECSKSFASRSDSEFLDVSSANTKRFVNAGVPPPPLSMMRLEDNTPVVLLPDEPSTSRLGMPSNFSGRVDNNLMRRIEDDVDSNDPEPDFMDDNSTLSITSNANSNIVIDNSNNR